MTINGLWHDTPFWYRFFGWPPRQRCVVDIEDGVMTWRWEYK